MSSVKKKYLRSRPSCSCIYFRSIVSSSCPLKDETFFFSASRLAARLFLLLAAASEDTCLLLSAYCGKLMADSLACHEVMGESPGTQQSNDEQYVLQRLECDLQKIRHSCGLFMREEAADFKSNIDTMVASIQEAMAHNSWQIDVIRKRLVKYDVKIEKMKEKYDQEIQGIKEANALYQEFIMATIDAAKHEGRMFAAKVDEMTLNQQLVMAKIDAAEQQTKMYALKVNRMRKKENKRMKVEESLTSGGSGSKDVPM